MVVMGGSGCGKSTLLRHLIGLLKPDEGSIKLLGSEITTMRDKKLNQLRKQFGILFQSGALFNSLTVGENVALILREHTDLDEAIFNPSIPEDYMRIDFGALSVP